MKTNQENAETKVKKTKEQQIEDWKKQWGKIYKTVVGDDVIIWRKMKRKEYTAIMSQTDQLEDSDILERAYERQKEITKTVVLYPENIEELMEESCGLPTSIADLVMFKSGFVVTTETEEL